MQFHFASPIPDRKASALEWDIEVERDDNRASQLLLLIRHQETHGTPQSTRRNGDHVVDRRHTVVGQSFRGPSGTSLDSPLTALVSGATVTFVMAARATSRVRTRTRRVLSSRARQISRMTQFSTLTLPKVQETRSSRSSAVPSERRIRASHRVCILGFPGYAALNPDFRAKRSVFRVECCTTGFLGSISGTR